MKQRRKYKSPYTQEEIEEAKKKKREWHKQYVLRHKEQILVRQREREKIYREENRDSINARKRARYKMTHPQRIKKTKDELRIKKQATAKEKYHSDISFRLRKGMSRSIRSMLNGTKRGQSCFAMVDFTIEQLKRHLEKQFKPGMSWENYGTEWHIDHTIPCAAFNITSPNDPDFKRCWSLKNMRPLWKSENCSKQDRLDQPFQPSLALGG